MSFSSRQIQAAFDDAIHTSGNDLFWRVILYIGNDADPKTEWEPQVRRLLQHRDPLIVAEAVEVLAGRWKLASFKEECLDYAHHQNDDIRRAAVEGLVFLGFRSGDYEIARRLFEIAANPDRSVYERGLAARSIPQTLDDELYQEFKIKHGDLPFSASGNAFEEATPWGELEDLLSKHRP